VRKINKIDEFYLRKRTLEDLKDKLEHYSLFTVEVKSGTEREEALVIKFHSVYHALDQGHRKVMYWKLREMLIDDVREELSKKLVKVLEKELEELKKEIRKDFNLEEGSKRKGD